MSVVEWRGGIPVVYRGTSLGGTPVEIVLGAHLRQMDEAQDGRFSPGTCKWMRIQNHDTSDALKIYFFKHHADNDEHYVTILPVTAQSPLAFWEGPVEAKSVWVAAASNAVASFDITAFMRRG